MPNENRTLIALVLDRSGSMQGLQEETIVNVNNFIREQQAQPGECDFTLVQFSTDYVFTYNAIPIAKVEPLTTKTYAPDGYTALLDAMGRCIDETGRRLARMPEQDRAGKVIVVIITDGGENASKEYTREAVAGKVKTQQTEYKWQFVFIGANMDAIGTAGAVGIAASAAMNYSASPRGTRAVYGMVSSNVSNNRRGGVGGQTVSMDWSPAQREQAIDPDAPDKPQSST